MQLATSLLSVAYDEVVEYLSLDYDSIIHTSNSERRQERFVHSWSRMNSTLHDAVSKDNIDVLKELEGSLKVGDQLTPTESTVLHLACQYGSIKCVEHILSVHDSLIGKTNSIKR